MCRVFAAVFVCVIVYGPLARAADRSASLTGGRLSIDSPCARTVTVEPDPGLQGQVIVTASAEHPEELERLALESGPDVRVRTRPPGCWRTALFSADPPTLRLAIRVPAGFSVAIDESGHGEYRVGAIGGRLALDVSGAADVLAQDAVGLDLDLSGAAQVRVASVGGTGKVDLSGHSEVTFDRATLSTLSVEISGAGSLSIGAGEIGRVTLEDSGAGTMRIGGVVGSAQVDLSGMGSVHFARVTGEVEKEVSGLGNVTVGP